jgi:AsmA protein
MFMTRRPITVFLTTIAVLIAGLLIAPRVMPDDYTRRQLARALERETGIELDDAASVRVVLFPRLGVVLEQVTLRTPGFPETPAVTAERVIADVDPWALFERRLHLQRLRVEKPTVLFHVNSAGRRNWDFGARRQDASPMRVAALGDGSPAVEANAPKIPTLRNRQPRLPTATIEISQGTLTYLDEGRSRRIEAADVNIVLTSSRADGAAALDGSLRLYGEEITAHASLRDQISLSEPSSPLRMEIRGRAGSAVFDGVSGWRDDRSLRGQLRLDLVSGAALSDWLGETRSLASLGPTSLGGTLVVDDQHAAFSDARLQSGEATGDLDLTVEFGGKARFNLHSLYLYGGRAAGRMTVDARQRAAVVAGNFEMSDVDSLALFKGLSGFDWVSGRSGATLHVAGGGESVAAVLNTLTGEGSLSVTDGAIEGLDIPELIAKARDGEFKPWRRREGRRTRFDSLTSAFTLDKGIARSRDLALTGPEISATGEGEANLPSQSLDYRLKVKVKAATEEERAKAEDGQVEIPLILRGPWEKPDIYPDLDKVLRDPKALSDTAKAIGKSVEKFTEGKIKSDDIGKALESLFGGKKKKSE